ncbi:MAG: ribonuclease P protein component [Candidatus Eremiobacteraeota bacterium]|nr:ribonuclease P protein component [Candidatus Eremiobacteraeota bacterium]
MSLKRQADFARLRRHGRRVSSKSLVIYRSEPSPRDVTSLVGITVNKSVGKAVVRNRLRRRLAAIVEQALVRQQRMRLLVIARPTAAQLPFCDLQVELRSSLERR